MKDSIERYFELLAERPYLVNDALHENLIIELDKQSLITYQHQHNIKVGVVYESPYHILLVDLVHTGNQRYFTYERLIAKEQGVATIMIATYQDKFVVLKQFRHALRQYQYAFVRGFGTDGLSGEDNAKKELYEEVLGEVKNIELLGSVAVDSGITDKVVEIYYCELGSMQVQIGHENIEDCIMLTFDELYQWIKQGKINDSFTVLAFYLYCDKIKRNFSTYIG